MRKLDYYWMSNRSWWSWSNGEAVIKSDAPDEAKQSYRHYQQQLKEMYEGKS